MRIEGAKLMPVIPKKTSSQDFTLSQEQNKAVQHLLSHVRDRKVQTLGGYAGTGKTSIVKHLTRRLFGWAVIAYTGKASGVLRRKGVDASTIHSLIYAINKPGMEDYVEGEPEWRLKKPWEIGVDGIIIDEASMVSKQIYNDLLTFDLPIIAIGDHGQLEPISGDKFNLMQFPDITLETIHRNAGPISYFAEFLRNSGDPKDWDYTEEEIQSVKWGEGSSLPFECDQIICSLNTTRVGLNKAFRQVLGYPPERPIPGDRCMILQNNREKGVFNGQQGIIVNIDGYNRMTFESNGCRYWLRFRPEVFNQEKPTLEWDKYSIPLDYCYAATAWKCQGSEWDSVAVLDERVNWCEYKRWAYTCASRARNKLVWVTP